MKKEQTNDYRPYTQSQIIDNTISCLLAPKTIDELGNAVAEIETSTTKFILKLNNYISLQPYISSDYYKSGKLKQSIGKLLDCFIIKMTEDGFNNHTTTLTLKEYADMVGKNSLGTLRNQTNNDLQILNTITIKNIPKHNKENYIETKLCKCSDKIENGEMKFKFSDDLFKALSSKKVSFFHYLPNELLQISEKSTNSYLLFKKILSNCWSNAGTERENKISVDTLYRYCSTLPRYDGVEGITQRLKLPLIRDLNKIQAFAISYSLDDYNSSNYKQWLKQEIQIHWKEELLGIQEQRDGREKHKKRQVVAKERALVKVELDKLKKTGGGSKSKHKETNK